ncbi:MAG: PQQ-dependent sugar dehydrogenase [Labilithrix sp.]|nr:PQQ-dependent sugar dehydrogenase [Labilithrix sp.]
MIILGAMLGASCDETFPRALEASPPPEPAPAPAWGLDARPVSATCVAGEKPAPRPDAKARIAFESVTKAKLDNLVDVIPQSGRLYVVNQRGYLHYLGSDGTSAPVVLDLSSRVVFGYDSGLLSVAFHPKFGQNGYVYVSYQTPHEIQPPPAGVAFQSVLARFQSTDGGLTIDPATEKRLLVRDQPNAWHNGNKLAFGPDGFLYFAVGDGGAFASPLAQDTHALFGKILRIDVDGGDPYGIPPTNPYALGGGAPEVFARGFRNPWRFNFDVPTGELWVGDVGQDKFEEIDRVVLGGNYGFAILEGKACFNATTCDTTGLIDPVVVYPHEEGVAVVGGVVYRGKSIPSLSGKYIYCDYASGIFWAIPTDVVEPVPVRLDEGLERVNPSSMGLDVDGEMLFVTHNGRVLRIVPPVVALEMPEKLSATGCVDAAEPAKPAPGLFPYDVNAPQWLDGSTAQRSISVPADAPIGVLDQGHLELPPRSIAMRTIRAEDKLLETQMLVRRPDGAWGAYTYAWAENQRDATLATEAKSIALPSGRIHHVRPNECATCHAANGNMRTLGFEAGQIDRAGVDYGGRLGNPLATLEYVDMLAAPVTGHRVLPDPFGDAAPGLRARAYLHANCSSCHEGSKPDDMDLRFFVPRDATRTCGATNASGAARLTPASPESSAIFEALRAAPGSALRMPPVGSQTTDERAVDLLDQWIRSLADCAAVP